MLKQIFIPILFAGLILSLSCQQNKISTDEGIIENAVAEINNIPAEKQQDRKPADAATILSRKQVPILCYHQIRDWTATDSKASKDYIIPVNTFKSHMKMLADSGYHSVLPEQVYNYLVYGDALPKKPVMLTFDDTDLNQYTFAVPELKKYGFKAVYFIIVIAR